MKTVYFLPFAIVWLFTLSFAQPREDLEEKRQEWFYSQRAYPKTEIEPGLLSKALEATRADRRLSTATQTSSIIWQSVGPTPIAGEIWACNDSQYVYQDVSGRVTALAVDPADPNIVYCGGAFGGVWKSTDAGSHWMPITDGEATLAVGSIAIDPNNSAVIYVGTGEANGSGDSYYGLGILKSTDGGVSWVRLGVSEFSGLSVAKIIVDPVNSNRVWVAATYSGKTYSSSPVTGIYLSTDGGISWAQKPVITGSYEYAQDLVMESGNPNNLYAALWNKGIYKTTNGGASWIKLAAGLPASFWGRISLAIAPSRPQRIYSGIAHYFGQLLGVYMSDDSGATWVRLPDLPPGTYGVGGGYWYYNVLAVNPSNSNQVFFGGLHLWRTNDSLTTWSIVDDGCTSATVTHVDHHALAFGSDGTLYDGNDGGVWRTTDEGVSWANLNSDLSLTQFVSVALHPSDSSKGVGGSQDNGYELITGTPLWTQTFHGDGGFCDWNYSDPNVIYGTYVYYYIYISRDGGLNWDTSYTGIDSLDDVLFYAPLKIDPDSAHWLYFGTNRLYVSTDTGHTWVPTTSYPIADDLSYLTAVRASRGIFNKRLVVGSNSGRLFTSTDHGVDWTEITGIFTPPRWVTDFEVSSADPSDIITSFSGFNSHTPGFSGHIFRTIYLGSDGLDWTDISGNLPDIPVNTILADPDNFNTILAGTDIGVFITFDGGTNWQKFGSGIPNVTVVDLRYNPTTKVLAAATHGRGMYWIQNFNFCSLYVKGDMDADSLLTFNDVPLMLNCVFFGLGNCSDCFTDVNCNRILTPADMVTELRAVFLSEPITCTP